MRICSNRKSRSSPTLPSGCRKKSLALRPRNAPMSRFAILNIFSFCEIDFIFYSAKLNYS